MDQRMFNAAKSGNVQALHQLIQENPFLLSDHVLANSNDNPLSIAIKANQLVFARELLKLNSEVALELNQDGTRPLDVASAYGNVEIVREILALRPESSRLTGREGRTAIHYAAVNGKVAIVNELCSACSDCAKDVTSFGETALHLAVKYFKFEVLMSMLELLEEFGMVEVANWADKEGNTVLHYAASRKQLESIEILLEWNTKTGNRLEVNAMNKKGLTATDIVDVLIESSPDIHLREILRRSGAFSSSEFRVISEHPKPDTSNNRSPGEKPKKWLDIVKHFEFHWNRDSPGEARETLLLVAALIATVTFEAGVDPPGHLFERSDASNVTVTSNGVRDTDMERKLNEIRSSSAELSILVNITVFSVVNSVAFTTALSIIDYLTKGLPFQRELRVSMLAMVFTYGWSLAHTSPTGLVKQVLLAIAISMPLLLRVLPLLVRKSLRRKD